MAERAADAALASLVLLLGLTEVVTAVDPAVSALSGFLDGSAVIVGGVVTALAQAGTVLLRRRWPRRAYALLALVGAAQFAAIGVAPTYAWSVLGFSVARAPGRMVGWLAGPLVASVVLGMVFVPAVLDGMEVKAWTAVVLGFTLSVFVIVGAVAGRFTRSATERAERERLAQDQARRALALATERSRIAEEIGSGVLAGLRRLVEQCARVAKGLVATDGELRRLSEESRSVLAAMRRVLGVLRADADRSEPGGSGQVAAVSVRPAKRWVRAGSDVGQSAGDVAVRRRGFPIPDRAGLIALIAVLAPALVLGTLPVTRSDVPTLDRLFALIALPLHSPGVLLVLAVQFAAVAWWRVAPLSALLVWGASALLAESLHATNLLAVSAGPLLMWGAASGAPARWSAIVVAVTTPMVLPMATLGDTSSTWGATVAVLSYVGVVPLWLAGVFVRSQRMQVERGRRERAEAADREIVAQERLRVARELHDVVAHHVSAVAVQAGAARMDPAGRAQALAHIADSGHRIAGTLPELAGLTPDPHAVVLDSDGLERLLGPVRGAGLPVETELVGVPASDPGDAELFAQRILTEALTNVLRHAGPSPTRVRVEHTPESVSLRISDSGPVPGHLPGHGTGLGLVGMRERAALLGGSLTAGHREGPGWTVRAELPRVIPA